MNLSKIATQRRTQRGYRPPERVMTDTLQSLLHRYERAGEGSVQLDLLRAFGARDTFVHYSGNISLLGGPVVSVVGTREISDAGMKRAKRLSSELAEAGIVVMSGLAKGVDTIAHRAAIDAGGHTAAVIGTPIDRAYPADNADLQMQIYDNHLLITPFAAGSTVHKSNFPERNRVMARLSDATVIVEASDTSGTLHQAAECQKSGRWLFIMHSVANDERLTWPKKFLNQPRTMVLQHTADIVDALADAHH